jgi:hypothetical protein
VKRLRYLLLGALCTSAYGQSVQFDRPGLGLSAYALPRSLSAVELGLPDGQWSRHQRTYTYSGLYRLGLGNGWELQAGGGDGNFVGVKYARTLSLGVTSGTLFTAGQGTSLGQVIAWTHGPWNLASFIQLGRGYETVGNVSYALGRVSPYLEAGILHDGLLGHSRVFGAGLAWTWSSSVQWDFQGRYLPSLHTWQAGWGLSFAF